MSLYKLVISPPIPNVFDVGFLLFAVCYLKTLKNMITPSPESCFILIIGHSNFTFKWGLNICSLTFWPNLPLRQSASTSFRNAHAILYQPP